MVLSSLSRPLAHSAGRVASRTRGLHTVVSPAAATSLRSSTSTLRAAGGLASRQLPVTALPVASSALFRSRLGPSTAIRSLTYDFPREKVKVLMVLYDGGQHAKDVSFEMASRPLLPYPLSWDVDSGAS